MHKSIRNLSACVEKSGELGCVVGCSLGGERWDVKEEGEAEEESVGRGGMYIMAFTDGIADRMYPLVIPSVILPVKMPRHCTTISV